MDGKERTSITPKYMLFVVLGTFLFSVIYYVLGVSFFKSPLSYYEYLILTTLIAVSITGGYQIFFWVQRNNYFFKTRCFKIKIDDLIPFWPSWVWIYSFLYYIMIGYVVVSIKSIEQGVFIIFGGLVLLFFQCVCFMFFPTVACNDFSWRKYEGNSLSVRYLKFIQKLDNGRNCFPSMHMSMATYISLVLSPVISLLGAWIFIALIFFSTVFVKQHPLFDLLPGVILGWLVYLLVI